MPSIALITREGIDAVADIPKTPQYKVKFSQPMALKIARIIYIFRHNKMLQPSETNYEINDIAARIEKGFTEEGSQFAHAFAMIQTRARIQAGGTGYLILQTKLSQKKLRSIRNPFDAAIAAIENATKLYHGKPEDLYKWIKRLKFEKENET